MSPHSGRNSNPEAVDLQPADLTIISLSCQSDKYRKHEKSDFQAAEQMLHELEALEDNLQTQGIMSFLRENNLEFKLGDYWEVDLRNEFGHNHPQLSRMFQPDRFKDESRALILSPEGFCFAARELSSSRRLMRNLDEPRNRPLRVWSVAQAIDTGADIESVKQDLLRAWEVTNISDDNAILKSFLETEHYPFMKLNAQSAGLPSRIPAEFMGFQKAGFYHPAWSDIGREYKRTVPSFEG